MIGPLKCIVMKEQNLFGRQMVPNCINTKKEALFRTSFMGEEKPDEELMGN
jgi:hypothetical protein